MNETLKKAWDRQWRGKILSTCAQHMDPDTGREAGTGWATFFAAVPPGSKVLDIGTGNGFVPLIALHVSDKAGKNLEIHGTDYAKIDPPKAFPEQAAALSRIRFHARAPSEALPFKDGEFDAVSGQHAIEYGDLEKSAAEVSRVLKKGGKVRFLMHAAESEIVKANVCKIEQARYILEDARLFEETREAVESGKGEKLRESLKKTDEKFKNDATTRDLLHLLELLWGAFEQRDKFESRQAFRHWISENRAELSAQKRRIEALVSAALDQKGIEKLVGIFEKHGLKASFQPFKALNGGQIGWLLEGGKE